MKTKILAIALFTLASFGASANETKEVDPNVRATELIQRVHEFRKMDRKEMTMDEKTMMKDELREIKKELRQLEKSEGLDDKVSISIGAIIIIILLLIIL